MPQPPNIRRAPTPPSGCRLSRTKSTNSVRPAIALASPAGCSLRTIAVGGVDQRAYRSEHLLEHDRRQPPGVQIVARAVIAGCERRAAGERIDGAVGERMARGVQAERAQDRAVRDAAERQDHSGRRRSAQLALEKASAGVDFGT